MEARNIFVFLPSLHCFFRKGRADFRFGTQTIDKKKQTTCGGVGGLSARIVRTR